MPDPPRILAPPPLLLFITLSAGGALQYFHPRPLGIPFELGMAIGMTILFIGGCFGFAALWVMHRAKTTVNPYGSPTSLVTHGPFRISRNPLYLTLASVHAALAIMTDSLWLVFGTILLIVLLDLGVIRPEERHIETAFGDEYLAYKARVRRWI